MKWDEAEQILWSQQLALGYGPQPPLYTWLQWLVCQLLGPSVLALALLKHALIVLTYCLAWRTGRLFLDAKGAWWIAGGLLLMPPFGWDSLRDQTHTIMVTAMAMGLWWAVLRQVLRPAPVNFVLIGLFCGLGMLSKYSYAMLIAALLAAAMSVAPVRRALFRHGWWWAPIVGLAIFAPHGVWLLSHWGMATTETVQKMSISAEVSRLKSLGNLAVALLATLGLWLLAVLASYRARLWAREKPPRPAEQPAWRSWALPLLRRYLLLIALALLAMVLMAGVSHFKQRWMLPLAAIAPLALYVWRPALLAPSSGRSFTAIVLVFALIFLAMASLRPWQSGWKNTPDELNQPVAELTRQLRAAGYDGQGLIVGADHMLAAMLHARFPETHALACADAAQLQQCMRQAHIGSHAMAHGILFISRTNKAMPHWWTEILAAAGSQPVQTLDIAFDKMPHRNEPEHYRYLWLPYSVHP